MSQIELIKATPYDADIFGISTWELLEYSPASLKQAILTRGHHSVKVDPLTDKRLLHDYGFYYCDTLIIPSCKMNNFRAVRNPDTTILKLVDEEHMVKTFHGLFIHGRFHRDFNLNKKAADERYDNWLKQLIVAQQVYGLYWQGDLAGFIGHDEGNLVLHALVPEYRGKGLSKYWWSEVSLTLFENGIDEIKSSISATNLAALNLYSSLGFSFKSAQDVYHRVVL